MNNYYQGYLLDDIAEWELPNKDRLLLDSCIYLIDNKCSLREVEQNCLISRSTLSRQINTRLRYISFEIYNLVKHQLRNNKAKYFK